MLCPGEPMDVVLAAGRESEGACQGSGARARSHSRAAWWARSMRPRPVEAIIPARMSRRL